jgi:hypothetical protein
LNSLDTQDQDVIKKEGEINNMFILFNSEMLFINQEFKEI